MFRCEKCGKVVTTWQPQCPACFAEGALTKQSLLESRPAEADNERMGESLGSTGFPAFDRLIGGAVRAGKIYFLLAEPGVGKTTLLLQTAANIAGDAVKVLFFTGEMTESAMREMGARFGVADRMPEIMVNKDTRELASIVRAERPAVVMVDSLQTLIGEGTKRLTYEEQTHTALVIRKLAQEATTA